MSPTRATGAPPQGRAGQIVRALVDAAVLAQRERTALGLFRAVRDRLATVDLAVNFSEFGASTFCVLDLGEGHAGVTAVRQKWAERVPIQVFSALLPGADRGVPQGNLIEDLPGLLARVLEKPREELEGRVPDRAVYASIPVTGMPGYAISASGPGLDATIASAFGLFGQQVGAVLDQLRRIEELDRSNRELAAVNQVARASAALGSSDALGAALEQFVHVAQVERAAVLRREDDVLAPAAQLGFDDPPYAALARNVPIDAELPWTEAALSGEPVLFTVDGNGIVDKRSRRLQTPPGGIAPIAPGIAAHAMHNGIALPLKLGDQVHGVLIALRGVPLDREDLRLLATLAAQIAVTLLNALLFQQTRRRVEELSLLLELGQTSLGTLDLSRILQAGARAAVRILGCSAAYLFLPDDARSALRLAAVEDPEPGANDGAFELPLSSRSITALAFSTRQPQAAIDADADEGIERELAQRLRCRSMLAVPLVSHDLSVGALTLLSRGERIFGAQDVRLASHVAQLLSVAIENAHLYAEQRARAEEMTLLNEVSRSLAGSLEMKPLLRKAGETLCKIVDASNYFILLVDPKAQVLRTGVCTPEHEEFMRELLIPLEARSISAEAVRRRKAIQEQHPERSEIVNPTLAKRFGSRALLAVPLIARDEPLGAVVLDDTRSSRVFSEPEMDRITAVCQQISLALLSARLYEDLRGSYAELARTQAELIERERLAALGELSASIAHEVRNPLGVIFNSLSSLRRLLPPKEDVTLLLDIIGEESDRLNRMVGDLLDYSRPLQPSLQPVAVQPLLEESIASARKGGVGDDVEVRIHVSPAVATIRADARLLRQALVNLITNAFQAMPRGGELILSATDAAEDRGPVARIAVRDSGSGIPRDVRERIFQPFFTTKATGTGLGLAVVRRIAEGHGGRVRLADVDSGTEFHLLLPL